ncbi:hypothetical protein N0V91_004860 [Didymella pomorum]|uniref:Uncharacterized protein n=1 Tax=Didymella pomorum TaxID=749634 RepID=A0A9W8ZHP9_9PLEO|nr:hypothetical protein N0V91_004860 [Didymella pomorum]
MNDEEKFEEMQRKPEPARQPEIQPAFVHDGLLGSQVIETPDSDTSLVPDVRDYYLANSTETYDPEDKIQ